MLVNPQNYRSKEDFTRAALTRFLDQSARTGRISAQAAQQLKRTHIKAEPAQHEKSDGFQKKLDKVEIGASQ